MPSLLPRAVDALSALNVDEPSTTSFLSSLGCLVVAESPGVKWCRTWTSLRPESCSAIEASWQDQCNIPFDQGDMFYAFQVFHASAVFVVQKVVKQLVRHLTVLIVNSSVRNG